MDGGRVANGTAVPVDGGDDAATNGASSKAWDVLGDFTTTARLLPISGLAIGIGVVAAFVALALLRLIGLFTNLFYFGRWSTELVSPAGNPPWNYRVVGPRCRARLIWLIARGW